MPTFSPVLLRRRQRVAVEVANKQLCKLLEAGFKELRRLDADEHTNQWETHRLLQSLFHDTATAKLAGAQEYVKVWTFVSACVCVCLRVCVCVCVCLRTRACVCLCVSLLSNATA